MFSGRWKFKTDIVIHESTFDSRFLHGGSLFIPHLFHQQLVLNSLHSGKLCITLCGHFLSINFRTQWLQIESFIIVKTRFFTIINIILLYFMKGVTTIITAAHIRTVLFSSTLSVSPPLINSLLHFPKRHMI